MKKPTKTDEKAKIIKIIRRIAKAARTASVSRWQFCQRSHVTKRKVERLFGSYSGLVEAAGLVRSKFQRVPKHSDEEIIAEMVRVLRIPNSKLTQTFFSTAPPRDGSVKSAAQTRPGVCQWSRRCHAGERACRIRS